MPPSRSRFGTQLQLLFYGKWIPSQPNPATVTGIVDGLVDNTNDQTAGVKVTIISATNGPPGIVFTDANIGHGPGFDVASGQVASVNVYYYQQVMLDLYLGNDNYNNPQYSGVVGLDTFNDPSNSLVFTPVTSGPASVPGPLPVFGAGAAFGWSRRLRRKIMATA